MKKAIYLTVLGIITAGCILWRLGNLYLGNFSHGYGSKTVSDIDEEVGSFTKMDLDIDTMDITILPGEEYSIFYTALESSVPEYYVKNDTLYVEQTQKKTFIGGIDKSELVITVPEGTELEDVDITADVGDAELTGLQIENFTCAMDVGNLEVQDSALGETKIEMNVGDVKLSSVSLKRTKVISDVGDVQISVVGDKEDYSLDLSADLGNVMVDGEKQKKDFAADNGKYDLTVTADVGDIRLEFKE